MVKEQIKPDKNWGKFSCRVLSKNCSYEQMRMKVEKAQFVSEVETTDVERRPKKPRTENSRTLSSSSEDEQNLQTASRADGASDSTPPPSPPVQLVRKGKSQPGQISVALESLENKVTACIDSLRSEVQKLKTDITQHIDEGWDTLIKHQEENHAEIKLIRKNLKRSSHIIPMEDNKLPSFPLQSLEEMRILENILEDDGQKQVLIRELELIGGRKLNQVVYNFMKHVMNKDVALSYSLKGAKKKLKFMDLILYRCILDAVRKNPKFAAATDEEINQYIGLSLVNARDRDKGRRSRLTPETPQVDSAHVDVSAADEEAGPSMA